MIVLRAQNQEAHRVIGTPARGPVPTPTGPCGNEFDDYPRGMRQSVSFRQSRRRGQPVPETAFVRGVLAWPLFFVGGLILFAAFKLSGESID